MTLLIDEIPELVTAARDFATAQPVFAQRIPEVRILSLEPRQDQQCPALGVWLPAA